MDKDTIKGILAKYSPPLSLGQMDEIAEAVMAEWNRAEKIIRDGIEVAKAKLEVQLKKSKSSRMTESRRGRTH